MRLLVLMVVFCASLAGCARKVTVAPETAASMNQRDWTIVQSPAPALAPAAAPLPAAPAASAAPAAPAAP